MFKHNCEGAFHFRELGRDQVLYFMIMILLSQHTEFPFVGKILRLQSSRLD